VLLELDRGVARLRLNRPEAANALDVELLRALEHAVRSCRGDRRVRAVLLSGEGRNFCAGGDVHAFAAAGERLPEYLRKATAHLQAAAGGLLELEAPVIALVQGYAAGGGGFGLVCAADLVLAGQSARFMLGATRVGMAPDAGLSVTLSRIIGHRRALELALTDRELSATEALELGLVTRVVPDARLREDGDALARRLADGPTLALAATKRLLWEGISASIEDALREEARTVSALGATADAREGLAAVIERRPPRFGAG
jgi:2-(1,2-epoxy-1,2-dihydrophenyl)acetyl-CoA isomerase